MKKVQTPNGIDRVNDPAPSRSLCPEEYSMEVGPGKTIRNMHALASALVFGASITIFQHREYQVIIQ